MTTFDAIAQIRREALTPQQALRFLVEHFGCTVTYAHELIGVVFGEIARHRHESPTRVNDRIRFGVTE